MIRDKFNHVKSYLIDEYHLLLRDIEKRQGRVRHKPSSSYQKPIHFGLPHQSRSTTPLSVLASGCFVFIIGSLFYLDYLKNTKRGRGDGGQLVEKL